MKINSFTYFGWLVGKVATHELGMNYYKLFDQLWRTNFYYYIPRDENRMIDGLNLRAQYESETGYDADVDGKPCSVLEMMVALAIRCDDQIMWDDNHGSRASDWFFIMIDNMCLIGMKDYCYDEHHVEFILNRMMQHLNYSNGHGGLFYTNDPNYNMSQQEIWFQMCKFITENDTNIDAIINDLHVKQRYFGGKEDETSFRN